MTIVAFLIDVDGCGDILFGYMNDRYDYLKMDREIDHAKQLFVDHLVSHSERVSKENVRVLCGSNRQSPYFDKLLANQHYRCTDIYYDRGKRFLSKIYLAHTELPAFAATQGWTYDGTLLSDSNDKYIEVSINGVQATIDCDKIGATDPETGELYSIIVDGMAIPWGHAIKIALVQKQIIHLSEQYPDEAIDVQFYDDRPEFFSFIKRFVTVPDNVKLTNYEVDYLKPIQEANDNFIIPSPSMKGARYDQLNSDFMQNMTLEFIYKTAEKLETYLNQTEENTQNIQDALAYLSAIKRFVTEKPPRPLFPGFMDYLADKLDSICFDLIDRSSNFIPITKSILMAYKDLNNAYLMQTGMQEFNTYFEDHKDNKTILQTDYNRSEYRGWRMFFPSKRDIKPVNKGEQADDTTAFSQPI